jgi:hypothetical protein
MYFRRKQSRGRIYLQIVESHRSGDQVRQRVIATLGRLDELEASGQLDRLLRSGARFVQQAMVLDAARTGDAPAVAVRRICPALLCERLWQETGCHSVITALACGRGHRFSLERAVFLSVLHRLMRGGSDLAADRWREDYRIAGSDALELHHLYRAMAWLGEALPAVQQDAATPFAPRCMKDLIEEQLFAHRRCVPLPGRPPALQCAPLASLCRQPYRLSQKPDYGHRTCSATPPQQRKLSR